jgi:NodT family efflux transporter outer membrane factor (OMF) lipoprotein
LKSFLGQDHIEDYNAAVGLSWEADIWGKIRSQKDAALNYYLQTYEAQKAVQTQIVAQIAQGYYNLLMLDEQLVIAKKNLALSDTILTVTKLQYEAGMATNLGVQQATAQRQATNVLIPQLEQQILIQENALSTLTGSMPEAITRKRRLSEIAMPDSLQHGVPAGLLSNRPDIRSQEMAVRIRNAQVGIAQAAMYPALTITASGGVNSFRASNWFQTPASLFTNVMGGITQPLFQRRSLKTNLEIAKIEREESILAFRQAVLMAVGQVSDALVQNEKLEIQFNERAQQVATLNQAINDSKQLFQGGFANYLEVITVQSNALQAELALSSIRRQQLSSTVELYRALGGGWQ